MQRVRTGLKYVAILGGSTLGGAVLGGGIGGIIASPAIKNAQQSTFRGMSSASTAINIVEGSVVGGAGVGFACGSLIIIRRVLRK